MAGLFQTVLKMSFTGSIVILVVLVLRVVLFKAPKVSSYMLWGVVLFRLLCPVSFSTNISVLQITGITDKIAEKNADIKQPLKDTTAKSITEPENIKQIQNKNNNSKSLSGSTNDNASIKILGSKDSYNIPWAFLTVIWFAGIIFMLIHNAWLSLRLHRCLLAAVPVKEYQNLVMPANRNLISGLLKTSHSRIYLSDYITSPFVCGIFNPRIYIPSSLAATEYKYIILHEQVHIYRKDYLVKLLAFAALTIHWFNPLVWLFFHLFEKDMEMSCDEAVIKKTGTSIRAEYSEALLKLASGKKTFVKTFAAFGENETKSRIKHIMGYKKPAKIITKSAIVILIATFIFAGGNPPQKNTGKENINNLKNTSTNNKDNNSLNLAAEPDIEPKSGIKPETVTEPAPGIKPETAKKIKTTKEPEPSKKPTYYWWREAGLDDNYTDIMDCAFVREMTKDSLTVDPLEYIESDDTKRIKELGLNTGYDLVNGYYFNNPDKTTTTWKIDENTEFIFLDWGRDFTNDKSVIKVYGYMATYTKDKELFRRYLATYKNSKPGMPFFFEVEDGVVKKLVERFFA